MVRSIAFARCLSALLGLQKAGVDLELNIGARTVNRLDVDTFGGAKKAEIKVTVCTTGGNCLHEILDIYKQDITVLDIPLQEPKHLPLAARDILLKTENPADLSIYLEDDLVIHDHRYLDKLQWFYARTDHKMCLMPHRYERIGGKGAGVLLVDGSLNPRFIQQFTLPRRGYASGMYNGTERVEFDIADNPHSGTFCLSRPQVLSLQQSELPREGFVGPLETAATLTVLKYFPVLKPARRNRGFLMVEHGHSTFVGYLKDLSRGKP